MHQYKKFDWGVPAGEPGSKSAFSLNQKTAKARDAYDGDQDTVSPYDDMHQYMPGDFGVPKEDFDGAQIGAFNIKVKKDEYDGDHDTVSPYDDMPQFKKFDWGVEAGQPGSKSAFSLNQQKKAVKAKDEYDGDRDTVSQYDNMPHYKKFDWGVPAGQPGSKSAHA